MAFVKPTPAKIKTDFPEFATVADAQIQFYIDFAARFVDESWPEDDYTNAIEYLACHVMSTMGLGQGAASLANNGKLALFKTIRSGDLTLTQYDRVKDDNFWSLKSSPYGRMFRMLLLVNKSGPRVAAACPAIPSGYAKDWPNV